MPCHANGLNTVTTAYATSVQRFEHALKQQENNVTEPGELGATGKIRTAFNKLLSGDTTQQNLQVIEEQIQVVLFANMQAIQKKKQGSAKNSRRCIDDNCCAGRYRLYHSLYLHHQLPSVVTGPISRFTLAIREIANRNYKHRIHIDNKDEFGKLADAFNNMAERLEYFESSNLNKIMVEKKPCRSGHQQLKRQPVSVSINTNTSFLQTPQALQLLHLQAEEIVGKPVDEVKSKNDLFRFLIGTNTTTPFKIVVENRENYFVKEVME